MRMMMGGGGMIPPAFLLARDDVQRDLQLSSDQRSRLDAFREESMQKMRETMMNNQGGDREAMRGIFQKMQTEADQRVKEILTADQMKRLGEIRIQMAGSRAAMDPEVQKQLGITAAQRTRLTTLQRGHGDAQRSVMERARGGEIEWSQVREISQRNDKALETEIDKVLSQAQKAKLKEMGGKPFERRDDN